MLGPHASGGRFAGAAGWLAWPRTVDLIEETQMAKKKMRRFVSDGSEPDLRRMVVIVGESIKVLAVS